jgi:thiamine-phosphate pyrophosphorylase
VHALRGLYAITDSDLIHGDQLVDWVGRAIAGGATLIQYRDKSTDAGRRRWEATDLQRLCRSLRVPLIINDDIELAKAVGADGVHLGQADASIEQARAVLGAQAIIGITCHNDLGLARAASAAGADYVAFGSFFPSPTKPDAVRCDIALLTQARRELHIPIVAIGGITPGNAPALLAAGADLLAVIHGVFGRPDVTAAARAYAGLFSADEK